MSSLDVRSNSAVMKRAEQLKRWEESDTNRASASPRSEKGRKIKFSSGCVFLAACVAGDKEEVIKLLENGADINTANVDGLTALHQACIDDNLDMVEFLVENGADINRQDNEGWTPLHATASCGFVSIARYLVENGADVAAVNSDGDLALDLAIDIQQMPMIEYMQKVVNEHQIDCTQARQAEETMMLNDAKKWLRSDASEVDRPHPKTGATALHVAAAKGYTKVLSLLLAGRANVDKQDNDGWTPLHAAAHWSQKEAAEMLVDAMADMDVRNYAGQTCIDVADRKMVKFLEELRVNNKRTKRRPSSQIRISDTIENHVDKTSNKIVRVDLRTDQMRDEEKQKTSLQKQQISDTASEDDAPWRRNNAARNKTFAESPTKTQVPVHDVAKTNQQNTESNDAILRRTRSFENDKKPVITSPSQSATTTTTITATSTSTGTITPGTHTLQGNISSSTPATTITPPIRRSFVPPVRDEESETQRKAHAKRVRETRRSTQGVTLDEIKSAEELVKKKNLGMNNNNNNYNHGSSNDMVQTTVHSNTTTARIGDILLDEDQIYKQRPEQEDQNETREYTITKTGVVAGEDDEMTASFTIVTPTKTVRPDTLLLNETHSRPITQPNERNISASYTVTASRDSTVAPTATIEDDVKTTVNIHLDRMQHTGAGSSEPKKREPQDYDEYPFTNEKNESTYQQTRANDRNEHSVDDADNNDGEGIREKTQTRTLQLAQLTQLSPFDMKKMLLESETNKKKQYKDAPQTPMETDEKYERSSSIAVNVLDSPVRLRDKRTLFAVNAKSKENSSSLKTNSNNELNDQSWEHTQQQPQHIRFSLLERMHSTDAITPIVSANTMTAPVTSPLSSSSSLPSTPIYSKRETTAANTNSATGVTYNTNTAAERRPSWRLKFDAGSKFKLEDVSSATSYPPNNSTIIPSAPAVIAAANLSSVSQRRINSSSSTTSNTSNQGMSTVGRPVSAPSVGFSNTNNIESSSKPYSNVQNLGASSNTTTVTPNVASPTTVIALSTTTNNTNDEKDNDKENDNRSAFATQAVIQRRRKPKRRSTGVVHLDMDDIDPERQDSANDGEEKESGSERVSRSRVGCPSNKTGTTTADENKSSDKTENGEAIDYKALWEAAKMENDKLKQQLKKKDEEIVQTRSTLEKFANATNKNLLSENEKRERRAMERKLSELEEELKLLQKLKTENERLRAENRALTRVVSKLTTSAQNKLSKAK